MTTSTNQTDIGDLDDLAQRLRGALIRPGDSGYDDARAVYNGMIDRHPAALATCLDADDVATCIAFARDTGIELAVRGGGHNAGGLGVRDDALVIDLGAMREVAVDGDSGSVRVDGGCTWEDVDAETFTHGLVVPSGIVSTTGVGGLTLGGGLGYHTRYLGLTIDSLLSAEVVLADGRRVTASATSEPDLFWALRGGGGNFGVVTSFEFQAHPVGDHGTIVAGPVFYDLDEATRLFRWYRERLPQLPRDLNAWIGMITVPSTDPFPRELWNRKVAVLAWCYDGPPEVAEDALAPTREFGTPLLYGLAPMPFPELNSLFNWLYPTGLQWYWRADFFTEITDEAIDTHLEFGGAPPSALSTMHLYPVDGAASDPGQSDTAYAYRDAVWAGVIVGVDSDPAQAPALTTWARAYWEALHPTSAGGAYVNFLMEEGEDRVEASYRGNYDRLRAVKSAYDPHNLFHVNQNIEPA
jgi:FAD/FMN-containing dehydrogenase